MEASTSSTQTLRQHDYRSGSDDDSRSGNTAGALTPGRNVSPCVPTQSSTPVPGTSSQVAPQQTRRVTFSKTETDALEHKDIKTLKMLSEALSSPTERWNFLLNDDNKLCNRFKKIVECVLPDQIANQSQGKRETQLKKCLDKLFQSEDMGWEFIYRNIPTHRKEGSKIVFNPPAFFVSTYILGLSLQHIFLAYHEFSVIPERFDMRGFMKKHPQEFLTLNLLAKDYATTFEKTLPDLEKEQRILFKEWLESVSRYITHDRTDYWSTCDLAMFGTFLSCDSFEKSAKFVDEINSAIMSVHEIAWPEDYDEPISQSRLKPADYTSFSLKNVSKAYVRLLELKKYLQNTISNPPPEQMSFDFSDALKSTRKLLRSIGHPDMTITPEKADVVMQSRETREVYTRYTLIPAFYNYIRETPCTARLVIDYVSCEELADIYPKPSTIQTRGKRKFPEPSTSGTAAKIKK